MGEGNLRPVGLIDVAAVSRCCCRQLSKGWPFAVRIVATHLFHFGGNITKKKKNLRLLVWQGVAVAAGVVALPLGDNKIKWQTNLAAH